MQSNLLLAQKKARTPVPARLLSLLLLAALLMGGCGEDEAKSPAPAGPHKTYQAGDCRLTMDVSASALTVAQTLHLQLIAEFPEGRDVIFPPLKDKLGEFTLDQRHTGERQLLPDGKTVRQTLSLTLVPALAGVYTIPPLELSFVANPAQDATAAAKKAIRTDELAITVTSVIPAAEKDPALRDIAGPHALTDPAKLLWQIALVVAAALLLAVGGYLLARKLRRHAASEPLLSPQERALRELERLLREDLISTGRHKEFYLGLSNLLRRYIEERFSLAAPERTTEEFLDELRTNPVLSEQHTLLLKEFLRHCDMVKFARYQPARPEVDASTAACRRFVEETPPQPAPTPEPSALPASSPTKS